MLTYHAEVSAEIKAPPHRVYEIISDYHKGHQAILPARYFSNMEILEGGKGAGTKIKVSMNVFGYKTLYHLTVTEPDPGRIIREEDSKAGVVTIFTIDPVNGGVGSKVVISTVANASPGIKGWIEKLTTPGLMRRIYQEELSQLAEIAESSRE